MDESVGDGWTEQTTCESVVRERGRMTGTVKANRRKRMRVFAVSHEKQELRRFGADNFFWLSLFNGQAASPELRK